MITSVKLGSIEENMLESIRIKTGSRNKSTALRKIIRAAYSQNAEKETKLSRITPGKSMLFKLVQMRVIKKVNKGGKLTSRLMKFRRLTRDHGIKGKYKMSDGTIVKL